ncbi:Protein CBG25684 [Caenorhabditis briggsae]|uniref:Protein CBG25684 n=1 Tax=Caenorhabditis briggsae TaxID=6238 RepID=B6ILM9_CAEBR|nr:Protein CBG25684 [Caenorhabditis briggsae]CAS00809.1 Protein CBG25684 [Caenorhabditis briggsae]
MISELLSKHCCSCWLLSKTRLKRVVEKKFGRIVGTVRIKYKETIWKFRSNRTDDSLPSNYAFGAELLCDLFIKNQKCDKDDRIETEFLKIFWNRLYVRYDEISKSRSRSGSREKVLKDSAIQASPSTREAVQVVKTVVGSEAKGAEPNGT